MSETRAMSQIYKYIFAFRNKIERKKKRDSAGEKTKCETKTKKAK